ncbi:uncharacterized protein VTP21DRAFT_433 [Calcarisporiella thermophila]|uniref:uncharacterized protein n=1 Tax=Calcarisporiella thermophila TaxID=911321 RepID=UPI003741F099
MRSSYADPSPTCRENGSAHSPRLPNHWSRHGRRRIPYLVRWTKDFTSSDLPNAVPPCPCYIWTGATAG